MVGEKGGAGGSLNGTFLAGSAPGQLLGLRCIGAEMHSKTLLSRERSGPEAAHPDDFPWSS
jgi:hypothetical protein